MEQQFCLKWNNHNFTFINLLEKLLQSENLVDVTLFAGGKVIGAHKFVLSACSSYFEQIFNECGDKHPFIFLKDTCYEDLQFLLEFMYRGEVNVRQEQLPGLIKTAESLKIKGLAESANDNGSAAENKLKGDFMDSNNVNQYKQKLHVHSSLNANSSKFEKSSYEKDLTNEMVMECPALTSSPSSNSVDYDKINEDFIDSGKGPNSLVVKAQSSPDDAMKHPIKEEYSFDEEDMDDNSDLPSLKVNSAELEAWRLDSTGSFDPLELSGKRIYTDSGAETTPETAEMMHTPKKFRCSKCNKRYAVLGSLNRHLRYECGSEPKFSCTLCSRKFTHMFTLKNHLLRSHQN